MRREERDIVTGNALKGERNEEKRKRKRKRKENENEKKNYLHHFPNSIHLVAGFEVEVCWVVVTPPVPTPINVVRDERFLCLGVQNDHAVCVCPLEKREGVRNKRENKERREEKKKIPCCIQCFQSNRFQSLCSPACTHEKRYAAVGGVKSCVS